MAKAKEPVPEGYHTVTPHLTLDKAVEAIDWSKKALGAVEDGRAVGPDGRAVAAGGQTLPGPIRSWKSSNARPSS